MEIYADYYEHGQMINSAALIQGMRRLKAEGRWATIQSLPGNDLKTIIKARLGRIVRRWRR